MNPAVAIAKTRTIGGWQQENNWILNSSDSFGEAEASFIFFMQKIVSLKIRKD